LLVDRVCNIYTNVTFMLLPIHPRSRGRRYSGVDVWDCASSVEAIL